jgi:hypothetical protein
MSNNLFEAHAQWANRPEDERFSSLDDMHKACKAYADSSEVRIAPVKALKAIANGPDMALVGSTGEQATLTHYAFGQLARWAGAPAAYLRSLPAEIAANCVNAGLAKLDEDKPLNLLFHRNGHLVNRALTSESYDRVWNHEIVSKISQHLGNSGWRVPPARPALPNQRGTRPATEADILPNQESFGLSVKLGDPIAPAGLYASDHDMFAFLVNYDAPVWDGAKFLNQGVFFGNSEVGDGSLWAKYFLMDQVCGNHICWGVSEIVEIAVRHKKGKDVEYGKTLPRLLQKWEAMAKCLPSPDDMAKSIKLAQTKEIAATKEEVIDAIMKFVKNRGLVKLNKGILGAAYDTAAITPRYGAPNTVWGMVNGITEVSQSTAFTDERTEIDNQAGQLMNMAF